MQPEGTMRHSNKVQPRGMSEVQRKDLSLNGGGHKRHKTIVSQLNQMEISGSNNNNI